MAQEIWKDIDGYEGLYQVSNYGRIKSLTKTINTSYNKKRTVKETILKPDIGNNGYLYVSLWKDGKKSKFTVHRLVGKAFVDNPQHKPCINHKHYNRQNASAENLEWVTHKENTLYSRDAMSKSHVGKFFATPKSGERYITITPVGHYRFCIERLFVNKTFATMEEAVNARKELIGW